MRRPPSFTSRLTGFVVAAGLALAPLASGAVVKTDSQNKHQSFLVGPDSFIDFGKLGKLGKGASPLEGLGRVKLGDPKPRAPLPKGKSRVVLRFAAPQVDPQGQATVDIELVALSLTSVNPVPLGPLGGQGSGPVSLGLDPTRGSTGSGKVKFAGPGKGTFDPVINKFLKVGAAGLPQSEIFPAKALKFEAKKVPFSTNVTLRATDSFCLGLGGGAVGTLCLDPARIPEPRSLALLGAGVAGGLLLLGLRRRVRPSSAVVRPGRSQGR